MNRAAILLPRLDPGDAVGNDARGMAAALQSAGVDAAIFAGAWSQQTPARSLRGFHEWAQGGLVIYHPTVYWKDGQDAFLRAKARKIVKYHNITPAEFFAPYNSAYSDVCRNARMRIHEWAAECDRILCDSNFNVKDLQREGVTAEAGVLPPFHDLDAMHARDADLDWLSRILSRGQPLLLSVGRIVPNKRIDLLIEALAAARRAADVRLVLAGRIDPALGSYLDELRAQARSLGIGKSLWLTDHISDRRLKALYLSASAYLVTSDHEGFCVPVIEAMNLGIPVVASGRTAVAETLGGSGMYFADHDPFLTAAGALRLIADRDTARELALEQKRQCKRFHSGTLKQAFLSEVLA